VTIFTGPPPILPPDTPPRAAPEIVGGPAAAAPEDPTIRPRARPGDLQETRERSILGGRTRTELASFRPRLRPKSAQQEAIEALAEENGTDAESDDPLATATEEAVAVSLKPNTRPSSFASIVAQAQQAAAAEPVSQEQRVAVSIPTATSVARAATERNQISLRKVNLIGVYGKPNGRRALVRMANGSYRKVQVGDRLDGGQVAAIGESELRYVKGGRSVVLKMPQG
jgi:Tfp pilus assembly protein PilP